MTAGRIKTLLLKEAYRKVQVKEGEKVVVVPAIQAILRVQLALAAKGNAPAQRAVIETIRTIEQELAVQVSVSERQKPIASSERSAIDVARRIAFVLEKGRRAAGRATQTE